MRQRIEEIDALRGLAALGVAAVYHVHIVLGTRLTSPLDGTPPFTWLHDYGWSLVNLFFVISGFIFAHVYLTDDLRLQPGTTLKRFAIRRFARLYPLHLVTLLAMVVLTVFGGDERNTVWHLILNVVFLQESGLNFSKSFNVPAWSLSVEEFCYLLFIVTAMRGSIRLSSLAFILLGLAMSAAGDDHLVKFGSGIVGFFVGLTVWRIRDLRIPAVALGAVAVTALMLPGLAVGRGALFSLTLWPATVLLALRCPWLAALRWLGDRSYSMYLIHYPVYVGGKLLLGGPVAPQWQPVVMALAIAVMLGLSDLSFRFLESPARAKIRARLEPSPNVVLAV